jgi:hypothetical protein
MDTEDGIPSGDRVELLQGSRPIYRDVSASSGRQFEVAPKDWAAHLRVDLFKAYVLTPPTPKYGLTVGRTNIGDPVHALPEHCDYVAFALVVRDDDWKRGLSAGSASSHLEAVQWAGRPAGRGHPVP